MPTALARRAARGRRRGRARRARTTALGARGRSWVTAVDTAHGRVDCDLVAVAAIPSPASEGPRQQGCKVVLDPARGGFRVVVDDDGQHHRRPACGRAATSPATSGPRGGATMARASARTSAGSV